MKKCIRCRREKPLTEFRERGGTHTACCLVCLEKMSARKRRTDLPAIGEMVTRPCRNCGEPINRIRTTNIMFKVCVRPACEKDRRSRYWKNETTSNGQGWKCSEGCEWWAHWKVKVFTMEPVACQVELTDEQVRVLGKREVVYGVTI